MKYGSQKHLDYIYRRLQQKCKTKTSTSVCYVNNLKKFRKSLSSELDFAPKKAKHLGFCIKGSNKCLIFIEKNMGFEIKAQTLVHEWAHAMTPENAPAHGKKWAENYYKAYRSIYKVK